MPKKLTTEKFIEKAKSKHTGYYNYEKVNYTKSSSKVIITCPNHGDFSQIANDHLRGFGCRKCLSSKQTKSIDNFVIESNKKHGSYVYDKVSYIGTHIKVTITCLIHGNFKQTPHNHLQGWGCSKCGKESHWSRSSYIKKAKSRVCSFYTLRCFNEFEEFYKIGITMNNVKERYDTIIKMPYSYEIISEVYGEAGFIWDLEVQEKRKLKEFSYLPLIYFNGSKTECFIKI